MRYNSFFLIDLKKTNPKLNKKFYTFNAETLNLINKNKNLKNKINEYGSINVKGWFKIDYNKTLRIFLKLIYNYQTILYSIILKHKDSFKRLECFAFKIFYFINKNSIFCLKPITGDTIKCI